MFFVLLERQTRMKEEVRIRGRGEMKKKEMFQKSLAVTMIIVKKVSQAWSFWFLFFFLIVPSDLVLLDLSLQPYFINTLPFFSFLFYLQLIFHSYAKIFLAVIINYQERKKREFSGK